MEIQYVAHSCFVLKDKNTTLVIDPYEPEQTGYKLPKLSADIVLVTHNHFDHNFVEGVSDYKLVIDKPGEYEVMGVFIYGIPTYHDKNKGSKRGGNIMYLIEFNGLTLLHTGDLGHELSEEALEQLPAVDILLIPVGGTYTIDAQTAAKVISSLEPGIVIPMHYQTDKPTSLSKELDTLDKFLDEMGEESARKVDKLKIGSQSDIPTETEVVVVRSMV